MDCFTRTFLEYDNFLLAPHAYKAKYTTKKRLEKLSNKAILRKRNNQLKHKVLTMLKKVFYS